MHVSIRELKNHLSKYLHQVREGETIFVTSHRHLIAKLLPIPQSSDDDIQHLLQMKNISWNGKKPKGAKNAPTFKGKTAADYVLEDRR